MLNLEEVWDEIAKVYLGQTDGEGDIELRFSLVPHCRTTQII